MGGQSGAMSSAQEIEEEDDDFRVGKFVWAKIVGLPWWPAKVVLPQVAPEYVLKFRQDDRILVYFFGTQDYVWLPRDTLRPFQDSKEKFAVERPMKTHKKVTFLMKHMIFLRHLLAPLIQRLHNLCVFD